MLVAAAVVVYLLTRQPARPASVPSGTSLRGVRDLRDGDVIAVNGREWIVEGHYELREESYVWKEHRLVDGADRRFLSVEVDDGDLELALYETAEIVLSDDEIGTKTISVDGTSWHLDEQGSARWTGHGSVTGSGDMTYADYTAGDRLLSFENFTGKWEASVGETLDESDVEVYPAAAPTSGAS